MDRNTKCTECGRRFDMGVVRAAFQEHFEGRFDYDGRRERLCFACACLAAARGRWHVEDNAALTAGKA